MKTLLVSFLLLIAVSLDGQKGKLYNSSWAEDGSNNGPDLKYSVYEKGKIFYSVSNNNEFIFVSLKIEDPAVQTRILKEGLVIWINMDNKTDKGTGIRFPIGSQYSGMGRPGMPATNINPDGTLMTPLAMANTIELVGFTEEESRRFPADNADNFSGSVKYNNDGILLYSLRMPLAKLPIRNSKEGDGAMPFNFGIEYGVPPQQSRPGGATSRSDAPSPSTIGRGGGGRPGGGGSPGGGGGAPGGAPSGAKTVLPPVSFWIKDIKLASGK